MLYTASIAKYVYMLMHVLTKCVCTYLSMFCINVCDDENTPATRRAERNVCLLDRQCFSIGRFVLYNRDFAKALSKLSLVLWASLDGDVQDKGILSLCFRMKNEKQMTIFIIKKQYRDLACNSRSQEKKMIRIP